MIKLVMIFLLFLHTLQLSAKPGQVAITIDDLPFVYGETFTEEQERQMFLSIQKTLQKFNIQALTFVIGGNIKSRHHNLLNGLVKDGHIIGNHTYSHQSLNVTTIANYQEDINKGANAIQNWIKEEKKYFRYPMLHHGDTEDKKESIQKYLHDTNHINAPVTIDNDDWMFNLAYAKAIAERNQDKIKKVGIDYLDHMKDETKRNQDLAISKFGRDVKHILVLHMNQLNADYLVDLLSWYQTEGWTFITTDDALTDPIYSLKDDYIGKWGWSWLRRINPSSIN